MGGSLSSVSDKGPLVLGYGVIASLAVGVVYLNSKESRQLEDCRSVARRLGTRYRKILRKLRVLSLHVIYTIQAWELRTHKFNLRYALAARDGVDGTTLKVCISEYGDSAREELARRLNKIFVYPELLFSWDGCCIHDSSHTFWGYYQIQKFLTGALWKMGQSGSVSETQAHLRTNGFLLPEVWNVVGKYCGRPRPPPHRMFKFCIVAVFWRMFIDGGYTCDTSVLRYKFDFKDAVCAANKLYVGESDPWLVLHIIQHASFAYLDPIPPHWTNLADDIQNLARSIYHLFASPQN